MILILKGNNHNYLEPRDLKTYPTRSYRGHARFPRAVAGLAADLPDAILPPRPKKFPTRFFGLPTEFAEANLSFGATMGTASKVDVASGQNKAFRIDAKLTRKAAKGKII